MFINFWHLFLLDYVKYWMFIKVYKLVQLCYCYHLGLLECSSWITQPTTSNKIQFTSCVCVCVCGIIVYVCRMCGENCHKFTVTSSQPIKMPLSS